MISPEKPARPAFDKASDWIAHQETQLTEEQRRRYEEQKKAQNQNREEERKKLDALVAQHDEIRKNRRIAAKLHLAMGAARGNPALQEKVRQIQNQKEVTERLGEQIEQERIALLRNCERERLTKQEFRRVAGTGETKSEDDALARAFDKANAHDAEREHTQSQERGRQLSRTFNDAARSKD